MDPLKRKALKILNSEELKKKHLIDCGYYRHVYGFSFYGRKYVVKLDSDEDWDRGGSIAEAECWLKYKDTEKGKILAPVLAHGRLNGFGWCVMPKLQLLTKVFATGKHKNIKASGERCNEALRKIILQGSKILPSLGSYNSKATCDEFGNDLHYNNWGMTNKGVWLILDYSEGGNGSDW